MNYRCRAALQNGHYDLEPVLPQPYSGTSWMSRGGAVPRSQTQKFGTHDAQWSWWVHFFLSFLFTLCAPTDLVSFFPGPRGQGVMQGLFWVLNIICGL